VCNIPLLFTLGTNLVPLKPIFLTPFRVGWVIITLILFEVKWGCLRVWGTLTLEVVLYNEHTFLYGDMFLCSFVVVSVNRKALLHDHWIMFFLQVSFSLHSSLKMIDNYILDIFLNEKIVYENMALLFAKTTTIKCRSKFLIYTLVRSTPYPFSK
jgi:hypothetical protein